MGQIKLVLVFYKLPAKALVFQKEIESWLKTPHFQVSCFLFLGSSANKSVLS